MEEKNLQRVNPDIFEPDDVTKSCLVSYQTIVVVVVVHNDFGTTSCPSFSRVNLDIIGCVWTGEFDLNTLCVDGEILDSGKEKSRIQ